MREIFCLYCDNSHIIVCICQNALSVDLKLLNFLVCKLYFDKLIKWGRGGGLAQGYVLRGACIAWHTGCCM